MKGKGISDIIRDPIGYAKELISPDATKLNNISMQTLNEYGNYPITGMQIARTPVDSIIENGINLISSGKYNDLKNQYGFDKMYHLALIVQIGGNNILVEKNEVINIEPVKASSFNAQTQKFSIPIHQGMTLESLINNTALFMGNKFYTYSAFNNNNCQNFILSIIQSNNLSSQSANDFIFQDVTGIKKGLGSGVTKVIDHITNLGSKFSRLIAKGEQTKAKKHITTKIDKKLHKFIIFILSKGFKFI